MKRRYDRLDSDADFDAHIMGCSKNVGEWCTEAVQARNTVIPSKVRKSEMGGQSEMLESEQTDCSREKWSSKGGDWELASMASMDEWRRWLRRR